MGLQFDYSAAKAATEAKGLTWIDAIVPDVDKRFVELGYTQAQVDGALQMYAHYVAWLFTPTTYKPLHRLAIALHFLFGRKIG